MAENPVEVLTMSTPCCSARPHAFTIWSFVSSGVSIISLTIAPLAWLAFTTPSSSSIMMSYLSDFNADTFITRSISWAPLSRASSVSWIFTSGQSNPRGKLITVHTFVSESFSASAAVSIILGSMQTLAKWFSFAFRQNLAT